MNFNVTQKHSHYLSLYVRRNGKWIFLNDRFLICDGFFFSVFWFLYWLSFFCCRPRSVLGCRSWYGRRWWMFSIRSSLGPTGNVRPISNQSTRTKADPLPFFVSRITIRVSILPSSSFSTFRWRHYGPFFFQPEGLPYGHWLRRPRWRHYDVIVQKRPRVGCGRTSLRPLAETATMTSLWRHRAETAAYWLRTGRNTADEKNDGKMSTNRLIFFFKLGSRALGKVH